MEPANVNLSDGSEGSQQRSTSSPESKFRQMFQNGKPSTKYSPLSPPSAVDMHKATQPPQHALRKQPNQRTWLADLKERVPMKSSLTGQAKAGKYGELSGKNGVWYYGEVLAGKPNGYGEYWGPKGGTVGQQVVLTYEGQFVQGRKEGQGTKYFTNGEKYEGEWSYNQRHGYGKQIFRDESIYEGLWQHDLRNGHGRIIYPDGNIFVGSFLNDEKEGLGTLYRFNNKQKIIAEYIFGRPHCATLLDLDETELAPLTKDLQRTAFETNKRFGINADKIPGLPSLQLYQPYKILNNEISGVRSFREISSPTKSKRVLSILNPTLDYQKLEMLKHSFVLLSGGDFEESHLLVHQLKDLFVLSGLDPALPGTAILMKEVVRCQQRDGRVLLNDFLRVISYFAEFRRYK